MLVVVFSIIQESQQGGSRDLLGAVLYSSTVYDR